MRWCGHCQGHFERDHYDDKGEHLRGPEYGPTGIDLALNDLLAEIINDFKARGTTLQEASWIERYDSINSVRWIGNVG